MDRKLNAIVPVPLSQLIPLDQLTRRIVILRGQRVMLSTDLAALYEVDLRSQNVTAKSAAAKPFAKVRFAPYAFTQEGIAMLSTVLRSHRAIQVSIAIMRAFVQLRQMLLSHKELSQKLVALEKKYDAQFRVVFAAIRGLMDPPQTERRQIGFTSS